MRTLKLFAVVIVLLLLVVGFLVVLPSLFTILMLGLLACAIMDFRARRRRNAVRTFNSAVRAVCHHEGAINKVALAFSKAGPIKGTCYEYARRLIGGEDVIDAAVMSRVPLQLRTAVALRSPPGTYSPDETENSDVGTELNAVDATTMPVYGQFIYLALTALITCLVLSFLALLVVPTLEQMFEEFYGRGISNRWMFSTIPAISILLLLLATMLIVIPALNRGQFIGIRLPRCLPMLPRLAERRAEMLVGLADAVDAGWPLGRALVTAHEVSTRRHERQQLERALRLIDRGCEATDALSRTGWLDRDEAAWLKDTTPNRMAELLRTIACQKLRDARANLRWMMAVFFPSLVLMLGCSVLVCAYGFFATLSELIRGLS